MSPLALLLACGGEPVAPPVPPSPSSWILPSGEGSQAAHLVATPEGLRLTWFEPRAEEHVLNTSAWQAGAWARPAPVAEGEPFFVNWADTPSVIRAGDGSWLAHYPVKSGSDTYAYDVVLARSADGETWRRIGPAHTDQTQTEHGFVSMVPTDQGARVIYLDGRNTGEGGAMSLRSLEVIDGKLGENELVDDRVCDCCGTSAAHTTSGLAVAYRDRSAAEIRDISVSVRTESGWTKPVSASDDGWQTPGCPVNGPRLAALGDATLAAWTTGTSSGLEVRVALSKDGGLGFAPAKVLAARDSGPVGRVDLTTAGSSVLATWLDDDLGVLASRLTPKGREILATEPVVLGPAEAGRATGFPRIAIHEGELFAVWTASGQGLVGVRAPLALFGTTQSPLPPPSTDDEQAQAQLKRRPDVVAKTLEGQDWAPPQGPLLVHLWATWCGPCRKELPLYDAFAAAHDGVSTLGLAVDDRAERVSSLGLKHPIALVSAADAREAFGSAEVPRSYLFDAKGDLIWQHAGPVTAGLLEDAVKRLP